jgi:predicted lipid-binding transport protein (Tim44 family)
MRSFALALALAFAATALAPTAADARRIGGGGAIGMQRSLPPRAPQAVPARPAAPVAQPAAPTAATAAAAAPRRSWLGPIVGLAAGLGIAALMSHLGFGAEFGSFVTLLLLGLVAVMAVRFLMRRFAPASASRTMQYAGAGAGAGAEASSPSPTAFASANTVAAADTASAPPAPASLPPAGFDVAGFERVAKMIFIRLQAANDAGDIDDLRAFTTPEMFAAIKLDLQDRGDAGQRTDVVRVDAEVLDVAVHAERQIVSVRFHGLIREEADSPAVPFDEVWHLVKPADGSREWAIAGIQQSATPVAAA